MQKNGGNGGQLTVGSQKKTSRKKAKDNSRGTDAKKGNDNRERGALALHNGVAPGHQMQGPPCGRRRRRITGARLRCAATLWHCAATPSPFRSSAASHCTAVSTSHNLAFTTRNCSNRPPFKETGGPHATTLRRFVESLSFSTARRLPRPALPQGQTLSRPILGVVR